MASAKDRLNFQICLIKIQRTSCDLATISDSTDLYCEATQKKFLIVKVVREGTKVKECGIFNTSALFALMSLASLTFYFKGILELHQQ